MEVRLGVLGAAVAVASCAFAVETAWLGTTDAKWTTSANWTAGVPGENDTAVFDGREPGGATAIDLTDATDCQLVRVTGASCPKYFFGTASDQVLRLTYLASANVTTSGFIVDQSVPAANVPEIVAVLGGMCKVANYAFQNIRNNSTGLLVLNDVGQVTGDPALTSGTGYPQLCFCGSGPSEVRGTYTKGSWTGKIGLVYEFGFRGSGKVTFKKSMENIGRIFAEGDSTILREVELADGVSLNMSQTGFQFVPRSPIRLSGGSIGYWPGTGSCFESAMSATGLFRCDLYSKFVNQRAAAQTIGIRFYGSCPWSFYNEENDLGGPAMLYSNSDTVFSTIVAPHFGKKGEASCIGPNVTSFICSRSGAIRYTGDQPEETDRDMVFGANHGWNPVNSVARIDQCGTGVFTYSGEILSEEGATSANFMLGGAGPADGILMTALADQPNFALTLKKVDSGRWVLKGANVHTGTTTVEAGTLALGVDGTLAASPVAMTGGTLEVPAGESKTLVSVDVAAGTGNKIVLGDGASLTVSGALTRTGTAQLDVLTGDGATFTCAALAGEAPTWMLINGQQCEFDANGVMKKLDLKVTDPIPAHGGVISSGAGKVYGFTTAGDPEAGAATLDGDDVTIAALAQKASEDAVVSLAGGKKLSLGLVYVGESGAGLTIGAAPGEGTLAGGADRTLTFNSLATGPTGITVNAAIDADKIVVLSGTLCLAESDFAGVVELAESARLVLSNETERTVLLKAKGGVPGKTQIVKVGKGTAKYTAMPDYTGDFVLADGTNEISMAACGTGNVTAFGKLPANNTEAATVGSVYVMDGATLFANDRGEATKETKQYAMSFLYKRFHFTGTGACGTGALIVRDYHSGLFRNVILDGDALFTAEKGSYVDGYIQINPNGTLDQQHHDLTVRGNGHFVFNDGAKIVNGGRLDLWSNADLTGNISMCYYLGADLGGSEDGPIVLHDSCGIQSYRGKVQARPVCVDSEVTDLDNSPWVASVYEDAGTNINAFVGPLVFAETNKSRLRPINNTSTVGPSITFAGPISGPGGFYFRNGAGNSIVCLDLAGTNNTFTGGIQMPYGLDRASVRLRHPTSLPDYSEVAMTNGFLCVDTENWTGSDVQRLMQQAKLGPSNNDRFNTVRLLSAEAPEKTARLTMDGADSQTGACPLSRADEGTVVVEPTGTWENPLPFNVFGGTLRFAGEGSVLIAKGQIRSDFGLNVPPVLEFGDGVSATLAFGPFYLGNGGSGRARMRIANATVRSDDAVATEHSGDAALYIGNNADGVLEIGADADVRTTFYAGLGSGHAAIRQTGGTLEANGGTGWSGLPWIGGGGYACYLLSGGTLKSNDLRMGSEGCCTLHQTGGTMDIKTIHVGRMNGVADLLLSGGQATFGGGTFALPRGGSEVQNIVAVMTVEGSADVKVNFSVGAAGGLRDTTAIFNLNGGSLAAYAIQKNGKATWMEDYDSNLVYINFDGGTFKPLARGYALFGSGVQLPAKVTSYAGGAVFDTSLIGADGSVTVSAPITAPTGKGIAAVPWAGEFVTTNRLVGPPGVRILGDGTGATAVCDYDPVSGTVTGVRVTCPGRDYTWAKAELDYGKVSVAGANVKCVVTNDCVLTDGAPASGGLVKKGAGTLILNGGNTYTGDTVVEGGAVQLAATDSLPANSRVVSKGGVVTAAAGVDLPAIHCVFAIGTTVQSDGALVLAEGSTLTIEGLSTVDEAVGSYTVAEFAGGISGVQPTLVNADELPGNWKVRIGAKTIKVKYCKGSALIVR